MSTNNKKNTNAKKAVIVGTPGEDMITLNSNAIPDYVKAVDKDMKELTKLLGKEATAKAIRDWTGIKEKLLRLHTVGKAAHGKPVPQEVLIGFAHGGGTKGKPAKNDLPKKPAARAQKGAKDEPARKPEPPRLDLPKVPLPKSVVITPHSLECYLGSFAVEALAKRDASEFLSNDKVFWYRRAMFPDPTSAKVQPKVMSVRVVERKDARFTRAPYTVWVDIHVDGDVAKCKAWSEGVVNKNKGDQE